MCHWWIWAHWISNYLAAREKARYAYLTQSGWDELTPYIESASRRSYSESEFPASLLAATASGGVFTLRFSLANKTALPLRVDAFFTTHSQKTGVETLAVTVADRETNAFAVSVAPLSASTLEVSFKGLHTDVSPEKLYVQFEFAFADRDNYFVAFYPSRNPVANAALSALPGLQPQVR